jgi:hypothetical protein
MDLLAGLIGLVFVSAVAWDIFQTVVVPRPAGGRYRIARNVNRVGWRLARWTSLRLGSERRREGLLGLYAPAFVFVLLAVWIVVLVLGYGLITWALRDELRPTPQSFGEAIYVAGTAFSTLGFGDVVPIGGPARAMLLVAAASGLAVVALVITFLFSLYGALQKREIPVVTLDARAGAPPSGVKLLETYARLDLIDELPTLFTNWEVWAAEVLDTHVAYPILSYFRSSHDNESWVGSLGAVLDAATLVLTTIDGVPRGHAKMMAAMGEHVVEDVGHAFGFENTASPGVARLEFDEARARLAAAGYALSPGAEAWQAFSTSRARYAGRLSLLAEWFVSPPSQWIGDRAPVVHRPGMEAPVAGAGVGAGLLGEFISPDEIAEPAAVGAGAAGVTPGVTPAGSRSGPAA